jgi:hypothetical protein
MNIGDKIKVFGLENFNTLTDFARAMGMKFPSLHQYLGPNPKREPGASVLKKLKVLGCDINWLLSEDTNPPIINNKTKLVREKERIIKLEREKQLLISENIRLRNSIGDELVRLSKKIKENKGLRKKSI